MTLNANSSLADCQAAYDDNMAYEEANSLAMARAFVTACRALLRRTPKRSSRHRKGEIEIDPGVLERQIAEAQRFIAAHPEGTGGGVRFSSFDQFRR